MGSNPINLSPEDILACDKSGYGWNGGYLEKTYKYA